MALYDTVVESLTEGRDRANATTPAAQLVHATKQFGGTKAVSEVSLELWPGEVLALLGENGAGKSTCVKLFAGLYPPDSGVLLVKGEEVAFHSAHDSRQCGIAVMHQHPALFADLSVAENIYMGQLPLNALGTVNYGLMRRRTAELLNLVGLTCNPETPLSQLRVSEQQLVEVARALSQEARVLIMDEPTAALSQREVERLFAVVGTLKKRGVAMMFVGHRMDEIYRVADRISVLRDGRLIGTERSQTLSRNRAVAMMVGRELTQLYPDLSGRKVGPVVLEVASLGRTGSFADVSLSVRAGEIVGLGGLVGSGRTEVARVLFGVDLPTAGTISVDGEQVAFSSPRDAMDRGVAYVSEDRIGQSLVMDFGVLDNASLATVGEATTAGLVSRRKELELVGPHLERLRLRFRSFDQPVRMLSGGNQQKVVLSKWLATHPKLLILDEPTQGIDVQTKADVHAMIADLARQGLAIIVISSELPELLGLCDRIVVLREGHVSAEFSRAEATQENVIKAATDATSGAQALHGSASSLSRTSVLATDTTAETGARRPLFGRELGLLLAMLAVAVPIGLINPRMFSATNLSALVMDAALLMIVAAAQMLAMIARNIDLSVASVIGLSAYIAADVLQANPQLNVYLAVAAACGVGLLCGAVNGAVITLGRMPAIVVTLGTLSIYRGATSLWAGGRQISADQVPQAWLDLTSARVLGVPALILIAVAILVLIALALKFRPEGRELYAIGSNPEGAVLVGLAVRWRVFTSFALAGLLAGLDGALWASRYATVDARVATGFELTVIAAVVVGGVAIRGGAGTVTGVALGALTLLVIRNGLTLVRVDPLWLQGVYGLVILLAVAIDAWVTYRHKKALIKGER